MDAWSRWALSLRPRRAATGTLIGRLFDAWELPRPQPGQALRADLDQHQLRRWHSFHRWATLAMLAQAFLVVAALTCNETQQLFAALLARPAADPVHRLRWSLWRRRHQTRARTFHYRRQANGP